MGRAPSGFLSSAPPALPLHLHLHLPDSDSLLPAAAAAAAQGGPRDDPGSDEGALLGHLWRLAFVAFASAWLLCEL